MGSKTNYSEKEARALAAAKNIAVSKVQVADGTKTVTVGDQMVTYHGSFGGAACWRVNGVRAGYIGEAIVAAISKQESRS